MRFLQIVRTLVLANLVSLKVLICTSWTIGPWHGRDCFWPAWFRGSKPRNSIYFNRWFDESCCSTLISGPWKHVSLYTMRSNTFAGRSFHNRQNSVNHNWFIAVSWAGQHSGFMCRNPPSTTRALASPDRPSTHALHKPLC